MSRTLAIKDLTCKYDNQTVLESLSLKVKQGEIVCLLGASGCGKTTLLKAISGLLPLTKGYIELNGNVIDDGKHWVAPEQRNIGMIFQDYALFPHLTVAENICFGIQELAKEVQKERVLQMLEMVHLQELGDRYPHQLSGGQQQRVAIARSLAYKPDLLLLDEPFSNIDTQVRHKLIAQIRAIFKQAGVTAIFVTHSREEAFAFADKMAVMNKGVIEQFGTASDLYHNPSSRFVADFLGGGSYLPGLRVEQGLYQTALGVVKALSKQKSTDEQAHVLFRPQHLQLTANPEGLTKVLEQQFMGDHFRYVIDVDGHKLLSSSIEQLDIGSRVDVTLTPTQLLAF
ncbi:ABC transporter ATP-binding protein [Vibrio breoganii]|uniref:ABC transporter ATP-binding protein n=1 Tax=Vibrio breoganii TaxID=553239 RepID=UPI000C83EE76|nr:ABC transporter ATP-binding protein [Vibrio breoganii]PML39972.1 ABC transporter [Vibrio breoganii]PMO72361.1 ABC transporter [Vibrio breoganii]PMO88817.1 ABC transporter [Vibrio breoganii]